MQPLRRLFIFSRRYPTNLSTKPNVFMIQNEFSLLILFQNVLENRHEEFTCIIEAPRPHLTGLCSQNLKFIYNVLREPFLPNHVS